VVNIGDMGTLVDKGNICGWRAFGLSKLNPYIFVLRALYIIMLIAVNFIH
jgi:hypothetical protein